MSRLISSFTIMTLGVAALTAPAYAQQSEMCGVRGEIVAKLSNEFKEAPAAVGIVDKGAVMEVFVSSTGTWTMLATRTDGTSCVVSAGEGWESTTFVKGSDA